MLGDLWCSVVAPTSPQPKAYIDYWGCMVMLHHRCFWHGLAIPCCMSIFVTTTSQLPPAAANDPPKLLRHAEASLAFAVDATAASAPPLLAELLLTLQGAAWVAQVKCTPFLHLLSQLQPALSTVWR